MPLEYQNLFSAAAANTLGPVNMHQAPCLPTTRPHGPFLCSSSNTGLSCEVKGALCLCLSVALGERSCLLLPKTSVVFFLVFVTAKKISLPGA